MRSRSLAWTLAVMAVLAVGAALALALGGGDESADTALHGEVAAPQTSVTETSLPSTTAESTTSALATTTSTLAPTTTAAATTTVPPPTTATTSIVSESGYVWVPKPTAGPNRVAPEGALTKHLAADIATAFGFDVAEVEAAIAGVVLPPGAGDNPEGWLAPGTYDLADGATALDVVQAMVDRRVAQLEERTVPRDQWYRVLTAASVIEKETYNQNEKPKVARVLTNRLTGGGPLQMDSIILYPVSEDRIFTTAEERASDQPYNSYKHDGLPPTPICSPDEAAIDAFLDPTPGDWWFYVTVDLDTGETRYAVTYAQHQENVKLLRAWLETHPLP